MPARPDTKDRILRAFLHLAAERGIENTATRRVAEVAGVNEVTIFRVFGDKEGLLRAAMERFDAVDLIASRRGLGDMVSRASTEESLVDLLRFMRDNLRERPELILFSLAEAWRYPDLDARIKRMPTAGRRLVVEALERSSPWLRPDLDLEMTALGLMAQVFMGVLWQSRGWLDLDDDGWERMLHAAIRPLLRTEAR